ncbi:hypothetical protein DSO57_1004984 [Entomophthora muscae]|uniref:Uncharacterized protein n=1 Tax=Entomophthora muscae TaxID=34485 RepID=A0ACC2SXS7_9FUNG|nr:hypothetical protein DSO57_1004984 [Entomophthora muscae]
MYNETQQQAYFNMLFYVGSIIQYSLALLTNLVIFILLFRTRTEYRTLGFSFILVLAISDFSNALHRIPLALFDMGAIVESSLEDNGTELLAWFCPLTSLLTVLAPFMAALSATLLSVERYYHVCLSRPLPKGVGWTIFFAIAGLFLIPTLGSSVTIHIILSSRVHDGGPVCFPPMDGWRLARNHMYYLTLSLLLIVLAFCYINIFLTTKRNIINTNASTVTKQVGIRVFVFLGLYLCCYIPMILTYALHTNSFPDSIPLQFIALVFNGFISLIDPILVLLLHRRYHNEFLLLLNHFRLTRYLFGHTIQKSIAH